MEQIYGFISNFAQRTHIFSDMGDKRKNFKEINSLTHDFIYGKQARKKASKATKDWGLHKPELGVLKLLSE